MSYKLVRNKNRSKICGVCAGISDFTGMSVTIIRIVWFISLFFSFSISFWLYFILCLVLPAKQKMSIPYKLPANIKQKLKLLEEKLKNQEKISKPKIVNAAELAWEKLIILALSLDDILPLTELWFEMSSKLEDMLDKQLTQKDIAILQFFIKEMQENLEIFNQIKNQRTDNNTKEQNTEFKNWEDTITPLKIELLLKTEQTIHDIYFSIEKKLSILFPYLEYENINFDIKYNIKRTCNSYLPETIKNYLDLLKNITHDKQTNNKINPENILLEQLKLLDSALEEIHQDIYEHNSQKLILHGKFLKEKFKEPETFNLNDMNK